MKGIVNFESIWRRFLKTMGQYYKWLYLKERKWPDATMQKRKQLYRQFIQQGNLCFDIGANMGSRVGCFLTLGAKVIALEPQEKCCRELQKVFCKDDVVIEQKGVGATNETRQFYVADDSLISSFSTEWINSMKQQFKKNTWSKTEQIQIITLDELIAQYGKPDFIKIDTEGFELEVLKGLSQPVKSLSFEYTLPGYKQNAIDCLLHIRKIFGDKAGYNISRDEAYIMHFPNWLNAEQMKAFLQTEQFSKANFGNYGDIYVKVQTSST